MSRAVFDTNVVVAGLLSPFGPPGRIVEWLRAGGVQAVLDDRIACKYAEVLRRPRFCLPVTEADIVLAAVRAHAFWVEVVASESLKGLPDPDDAPFVECARAAGVPLVTGKTRHHPKPLVRGVSVITPARFVELTQGQFES